MNGKSYPPPPKLEVYFDDHLQFLGLRAEKDIPAGMFLVEYTGQDVPRSRETNAENFSPFLSYAFCRGNERTIDASEAGNISRFANHHCGGGNCESVTEPRSRVSLVSTVAIPSGNPITYDYGQEYRGIKTCRCPNPTHHWPHGWLQPREKGAYTIPKPPRPQQDRGPSGQFGPVLG